MIDTRRGLAEAAVPLTYQSCSLQVPPDASAAEVPSQVFVSQTVVGRNQPAQIKQALPKSASPNRTVIGEPKITK